MLRSFAVGSFLIGIGFVPFAWSSSGSEKEGYPTLGTIERLDPRLDRLLPRNAALEILAQGFTWTEGPVWVPGNPSEVALQVEGSFDDLKGAIHSYLGNGSLLFSDIPRNSIFKWEEGKGISLFQKPSGYTGKKPRGGEPGSNALILDPEGRLVLCCHGDHCIARIDKDEKRTVLVDSYEGKRLNSPNDGVFRSNGDFYFTDPPYGMEKNWEDPARELEFCGVYRFSKDGKLTLLTKEMTRPNGIAFSPDEKTLYVANSDPDRPVWMAFDVKGDGTLGQGRVFHDCTEWVRAKKKGLPDGMKVDREGNLFATGPGGLHVFTPDGTLLGTLATGVATANCNWGNDGSVLYVAADKAICRIRTSTVGKGF
jgi:gluconolactonase